MSALSDALRGELCCYRCARCGHRVCRDVAASPLEDDGICADCIQPGEDAS